MAKIKAGDVGNYPGETAKYLVLRQPIDGDEAVIWRLDEDCHYHPGHLSGFEKCTNQKKTVVVSKARSDGYVFIVCRYGKQHIIVAGCRRFYGTTKTVYNDALEFWHDGHKVAQIKEAYSWDPTRIDTEVKSRQALNKESRRIVERLRDKADKLYKAA